MSINADYVLENANVGYVLYFANEPIAEIIDKSKRQVKIRDINTKHWLIKLDQLQGIEFSAFIADLAASITQFWHDSRVEPTAREALGSMSLGDVLQDGDEHLARLINIDLQTDQSPTLTFEDGLGKYHIVHLETLPKFLTLSEYTHQFKQRIPEAGQPAAEPLLLRYFNEEFIPRMLEQLKYDHERLGDTWLMGYCNGLEGHICERYNKYFEMFEAFGKEVPWLKVAGYAIIAQAHQDHPEWLL